MLPEEAQAMMMKILLLVFGTIMLCVSKVRASDIPAYSGPKTQIVSELSQSK